MTGSTEKETRHNAGATGVKGSVQGFGRVICAALLPLSLLRRRCWQRIEIHTITPAVTIAPKVVRLMNESVTWSKVGKSDQLIVRSR